MKQNIQRAGGVLKALDHPGEHILRREHLRLNPRMHNRAPAPCGVTVQQHRGVNIFRDVEFVGGKLGVKRHVRTHCILQRVPGLLIANVARMTMDLLFDRPDIAS